MKEHYGTYPTYNEILEDYEDIVEIMKPARTFDDLLEIQKNIKFAFKLMVLI